jgi:hypothetical protein
MTFRCNLGGRAEDETFNLSRNEKSRVISTTKMMHRCKQKLYRYLNQNVDDNK